MPSQEKIDLRGGYRIRDQQAIHYLTFTVQQWADIFTRQIYRDIIIDAFKFAQDKKGLHMYGYVIMTNHIHCILSAEEDKKLSNIVRDFKSFTANSILQTIQTTPESRKEWLLNIFQRPDPLNPNKSINRFWTDDNHPIELVSNHFKDQKLEYIHQNPVRAGFVQRPEDWIYSSASTYAGEQGLLPITFF